MKDDVRKIVNEAKGPVMILLVEQGCDKEKSPLQISLEQKVINLSISLHTFCISGNSFEFPQFLTPSIYYFTPQKFTPSFWRKGIDLDIVENDVEIINKMMNGSSYQDARFTPEEQKTIVEIDNLLEEEEKNIKSFPSAFQQARNLAKEMWKTGKAAAKGLPVLVSTEEGYRRLSVCENCEKLEKASYRCSECGCFMKTKTQLATASCPIGKWNAVV